MNLSLSNMFVLPPLKFFVLAGIIALAQVTPIWGNEKTITMCVEHWPPFMIVEAGKEITQGTWVVLVTKIINQIPGYSVKFKNAPFKRCLLQIKRGLLHGTFGHFKNPDRAAYMDYTEYLVSDRSLVWYSTKNFPDGIQFNHYQDLTRYTMGLARGDKFNKELDKLLNGGELIIEYVTSDAQNFKKLSRGRIDIIIKNEKVGKAVIDELKVAHLVRAANKPAYENFRYISFSKKNGYQKLIKQINLQVKEMKKKGEIRKMLGY